MTAQSSAGRAAFVPTTGTGRWAGWLLVSSTLLLALLIVAFNTGAFGEVIKPGTVGGLALWVVTAISAVGTLITGAVSWLRFKDHSIVVIGATVLGVLMAAILAFGAMPQD